MIHSSRSGRDITVPPSLLGLRTPTTTRPNLQVEVQAITIGITGTTSTTTSTSCNKSGSLPQHANFRLGTNTSIAKDRDDITKPMKLNFQSNKTQTVNIGNARNVSLLKTSSLDESRNIGLGKSQRRRNKSASNISGPKSTLKGHKFSISSRPQRNAIVASSNNQTTADSLHLSLNSVCSLSERTREHQNCGSPLDAVKNVTRVGPLSTPGSSGTRNTFESQQTEDFTNSTASTLQSSSNCNNCQIKGTIASDKTSINVKPELQLKNLKEWTLCHLNLAQEQQSIIDDKDKLIAELRAENLAVRV